ncbi:MAG: hypothetical protein AB8G22_28945 [Saprospiraceae bacterium]
MQHLLTSICIFLFGFGISLGLNAQSVNWADSLQVWQQQMEQFTDGQFLQKLSQIDQVALAKLPIQDQRNAYATLAELYAHPNVSLLDSAIVFYKKELKLLEADSTRYQKWMQIGNCYGRLSQFQPANKAYLQAYELLPHVTFTEG